MRKNVLITTFLLAAAVLGKPPRLPAADIPITVNGLTGEGAPALTIARPEDTVIVTVCPADFINYSYTIDKTKEEAIKESFPIVGISPPASQATGAIGQTAAAGGDSKAAVIGAKSADEENLLKEFWSLRDAIDQERKDLFTLLKDVDQAAASLSFSGGGCSAWPSDIANLTGSDPTKSFSERSKARRTSTATLGSNLRNLLAKIDDAQLRDKISGGKASEFLTELGRKASGLQSTIDALQNALNEGNRIVDRWSRIITLHQAPKLVKKFQMPQTSTRILISVSRTPITDAARNEAPEKTEPAKITPSVIATTTVEDRAFHHFNVSTGMVGTWKGDNRDFDITPSVGDDGTTVTFRVRQTKHDSISTEAAAFLGIYLNPQGVDAFNPNRGPAWMVMLGSEISSSPKDFFLGIGRDYKQGVVFGFGVTEYQRTDPSQGLRLGQVIPAGADGKPRISISKSTKNALGGYLFLGFRPSIFKAFLDSRSGK